MQALKGIDLEVYPAEFAVIVGKSGSGKTTLVNLTAGLDRPTGGEIFVTGAPLHQMSLEVAARWRSRKVGLVFQSFELLPGLSVLNNVLLPMELAGGWTYREALRRALNLLDRVGIVEHARKLPAALSGGQQQRAAIARALANDPALLFADEPTGSLDSHTARVVLDLFTDLVEQGRTIFLVTHDREIAHRATRLVTLADGEITSIDVPLKNDQQASTKGKEEKHAARAPIQNL